MTQREALRDWWRGYTDADMESARAIFARTYPPGAFIEISQGEMRAIASSSFHEPVVLTEAHCANGEPTPSKEG